MTEQRTRPANAPLEQALAELLATEPRVAWGGAPKAARITRKDVRLVRALIAAGVVAVVTFLAWFFAEDRLGPAWLSWPLTAMFLFLLALTLYEWFCYLGVQSRAPLSPAPAGRSVDILTTWCPGEPREMVVATLKACGRVRHPHVTWLCDEGDDPLLQEVCAALGVRHVTRTDKTGGKAGNINNALRHATGEIAVILDPDHEPAPFFLERVLSGFDDPKVGFVQSVQAYYNQDESLIARGAAQQTYHFYGPVMTGMHGHGTVQAIGANCAFRRAALDSIDGHAAGLAEDMWTTLRLYAAGWTSVYVPEVLTRGLVPNTLAGYLKQQLKWACGVWDLLLAELRAAWSGLSWRNRLHFPHNGLFYLRGPFVLVGALVPVAALTTGVMPWRITILEFVQWFGPVLAAQVLVRQAVQRWVMEPGERGFHLMGGALLNATWLTHTIGALCALRGVKIPYIPTPKDDAAADAWRISAPNFSLAALCLGAAVYGLSYDWSPYSGLMAAFATATALSLGFVAIVSQQRTLARLRSRIGARAAGAAALAGGAAARVGDGLLRLLRRQAGVLMLLVLGAAGVAATGEREMDPLEMLWAEIGSRTERDSGGFMLGAYQPDADTGYHPEIGVEAAMAEVEALEARLGRDLSIVSIYQPWGAKALSEFPLAQLEAVRARGAIPMITWEPLTSLFDEARAHPDFAANRKVFEKITDGVFDGFLAAYAGRLRDFGGPVFLRFAHEPDNPSFAWSPAGGNTPEEFKAAWRYVFGYFDGMGATNVAWVFSPWRAEAIEAYHPGDGYVDWVGLTVLNYGAWHGNGTWQDFELLYRPFRERLVGRPAPVMIAELGSTDFGGDRAAWVADAAERIAAHEEIGATVLFESGRDLNWPTDWAEPLPNAALNWRIGAAAAPALRQLAATRAMRPAELVLLGMGPAAAEDGAAPLRVARDADLGWRLTVPDAPEPIRGVAYGVGQGWRSGEPATRWTVEADFADIAAMGANVVRRYAFGWEDRNILRAAEHHGLKVLMGVWLDPSIDYLADAEKLAEIEAQLRDSLASAVDYPAVLGWGVGNETWGLLKHRYAQPRLTEQRHAYLAFVERLTRIIKRADPDAFVFTAVEGTSELPGALNDVNRRAPSIDAIGVNAYYDEGPARLARLPHLTRTLAGDRPWFLSEFGPDGYWDPERTAWSPEGFPLEATDARKAELYAERWTRYGADPATGSLGAVAFSFTDRLEGSATWFGLVDFERRRKPAYYALAKAWGGDAPPLAPLPEMLSVRVEIGDDVLTATVTAQTWPEDCRLEAVLRTEATFETVAERTAPCAPGALRMPAPERPGRYRLTVSAVNGRSVTTASAPAYVGSD